MSNKKDTQTEGMSKGLTQYGDPGFSLFLRKAFIKGAGYTDSALDRPVIGIANTGSAYNPCHGNAPQLIEAIERGVMPDHDPREPWFLCYSHGDAEIDETLNVMRDVVNSVKR